MDWNSLAALATVATALFAFFAWQTQRREGQLRRSEVYKWAEQGVTMLQTAFLTMQYSLNGSPEEQTPFLDLATRASVLAEIGRLFFRNSLDDAGSEKHAAYQGRRPEILDQLLIAHSACLMWESAELDTRRRLRMAVGNAERAFVSLAQTEVGRSRTVARPAGKPGNAVDIADILSSIDDARLTGWERSRVTPDGRAS